MQGSEIPADDAVRRYYNDFARNVLLQGFRRVNARLEAVKGLCDRFVRPGATVLEVGCGVGILSKHLKRRASSLLAVDISDTNVKVAAAYAGGSNAHFRLADVLAGEIEGTFDVVVLPDVIEHIAAAKHTQLFEKLERHLRPGGILIVTFPSPEHQQYLRDNKREALQIVDEEISPVDVIGMTSLKPIYLAYANVFGTSDYVHLVLAKDVAFSPSGPRPRFGARLKRKLRNLCWLLRNRSFDRRIRNVLREEHKHQAS